MLSVEDVAGVCHEANWALCQAVGDVASHWAVAPDWQQQSAIQGVIFAISHPEATPEDQHNAWLDAKRHDGWCYGPIKNEMEKNIKKILGEEEEMIFSLAIYDEIKLNGINKLTLHKVKIDDL